MIFLYRNSLLRNIKMFLLILTASTVFFCCKGTSKQITVSSDKLKEFFFYKGATDYLEPPVKEIYFGRIKSIKSLYNNFSDEQHGQNFEKFYFNENGIKVRIEGGQTGTIDTILWYRTIEYLNSTKKESYYLRDTLRWSRRWDYYKDKGVIVDVKDSLNYNIDTIGFYRLLPSESIVEGTAYGKPNLYTYFKHYNEYGEIDYFGDNDFRVDENDNIIDVTPIGRTIKLKRKFDENGCYCEQKGMSKSYKVLTKFENDKFCNRVGFGDSKIRYSYIYDDKNNWIKKYEVSYENKFKPDTLSIELREIEYYK
jgi:hypothetical protein